MEKRRTRRIWSPRKRQIGRLNFVGWSNESMVEAMKAVKEGQFGVNRATLEYGVPKTTLKDRLNGRVIHGTNMGPTPYLTYEEEKELVSSYLTVPEWVMGKLEASC